MPPTRKAPVLTQRRRHRANPITLRVKQDDYDRAQVLAQLAADLASDPRIGRSVLFKGGAILQMGHQSPRFSPDLDATAIARQTIQKRWVEDVLNAHRVGGLARDIKTCGDRNGTLAPTGVVDEGFVNFRFRPSLTDSVPAARRCAVLTDFL